MLSQTNPDLLLIYPPVAKPAEPPAGVAQLKSALLAHHRSCTVLDANIAGQLYLLNSVQTATAAPVKAAIYNRAKNLQTVRSVEAYKRFDHYKRSVLETGRLLAEAGRPFNASISFTDFKQKDFLPVRSDDLLRAAAAPEKNPLYHYFVKKLLPQIEKAAPAVIGISLIYLSQAVTAFALIGLLRRTFPGAKIILGGGLVTSWTSQPGWTNPFSGLVDDIVSGRGEKSLLEILGETPADDRHYTPNYDDTNWRDYFSPAPILPYTTSYGCYWRHCTFCPECAEGNRFDPAPHAQAFADLETLAAHQPALIHFLDNAISPALLNKIATRHLPAPWYGYVRFTDDLLDLDFCRALRRSGCILLQLGLESGNQRVLDDMQKGINLNSVSTILRNLRDAGIATYIYLLFGTPYETLAEARHTIEFTIAHADFIHYINPAIFNMPVFSDEAAAHATRVFYEGDLTLYHDFDHPQGWNRGLVRQFLQKEFRSHPVIKKILQANPPFFTSNHAPFFTRFFLEK